jgi:hypothetical protein
MYYCRVLNQCRTKKLELLCYLRTEQKAKRPGGVAPKTNRSANFMLRCGRMKSISSGKLKKPLIDASFQQNRDNKQASVGICLINCLHLQVEDQLGNENRALAQLFWISIIL